jgi:phage terminase large subunit-like protein
MRLYDMSCSLPRDNRAWLRIRRSGHVTHFRLGRKGLCFRGSGASSGDARWITQMPLAKMTTALTHDLVAETLERANRLLPGNDGQARAHRVMTTLPTRTPEGSGSCCP